MSLPDEAMRRLLTVIHYPVFGGPHNHVVRLATPLEERRWTSFVLLPDDPGNGADRLREAGVHVFQIPLHRLRGKPDPVLHARYLLNLKGDIAAIRRIIREQRIDLVRVIGLLNLQAGVAARMEGVPVVWQIGDSRPPQLIRRAYMPMINTLADTILFTGRRLVELHGGEGAMRVPWFAYYPPVDTDRFRPNPPARVETRRRLGIPLESTVIGIIANLNPQKGIDHFIQIASILHCRCSTNWYLIVGERYHSHRRYWSRLQEAAAASGIPKERMLFVGGTKSPESYYPAMDIKLITSRPRSEGIPTTALEAMACGVPVIASDVGALREVVGHGVTGFLVPPVDAEASSAAAQKLIEAPALRGRMAREARRAAVERFDLTACANTIDDALNSAVRVHREREAPHGWVR